MVRVFPGLPERLRATETVVAHPVGRDRLRKDRNESASEMSDVVSDDRMVGARHNVTNRNMSSCEDPGEDKPKTERREWSESERKPESRQ